MDDLDRQIVAQLQRNASSAVVGARVGLSAPAGQIAELARRHPEGSAAYTVTRRERRPASPSRGARVAP